MERWDSKNRISPVFFAFWFQPKLSRWQAAQDIREMYEECIWFRSKEWYGPLKRIFDSKNLNKHDEVSMETVEWPSSGWPQNNSWAYSAGTKPSNIPTCWGKCKNLQHGWPDELSDNKMRRLDVCSPLTSSHDIGCTWHNSLICIIVRSYSGTCMWSWRNGVTPTSNYSNQWCIASQKTVPTIRNIGGVIQFKLLPQNAIITRNLYSQQMLRLAGAASRKRPKCQDEATPWLFKASYDSCHHIP